MANVGQLPTHKCKREDGLLLRQCCLSSAACNGVDTEATRHALLGPARAVYMVTSNLFLVPALPHSNQSKTRHLLKLEAQLSFCHFLICLASVSDTPGPQVADHLHYHTSLLLQELPFEFPSVDDTDDSDSDFEVQPFQFSTVDDEGVLYARLHKGEVLAGGDRRPLMETTVTEGFPLASPTPGEPLQGFLSLCCCCPISSRLWPC